MDKTTEPVAPTPPPTKPTHATVTEIYERGAEIQRSADAAIGKLRAEAAALNAVHHPLNVLVEQRTAHLVAITRGESAVLRQETRAAKFRQFVRSVAGHDHPSGPDNAWQFMGNDPANVVAERLAFEYSQWVAERRTETPGFEARIRDYANTHSLQHLLPADLR